MTVQLTFTEGKGVVKEDTPMWRRMLDDALKRALASVCLLIWSTL